MEVYFVVKVQKILKTFQFHHYDRVYLWRILLFHVFPNLERLTLNEPDFNVENASYFNLEHLEPLKNLNFIFLQNLYSNDQFYEFFSIPRLKEIHCRYIHKSVKFSQELIDQILVDTKIRKIEFETIS